MTNLRWWLCIEENNGVIFSQGHEGGSDEGWPSFLQEIMGSRLL